MITPSSAAPSAPACGRSTSSSCAVMAALELKRSVRVVLTRQQMFSFGHRPGLVSASRSAPTPTARSTRSSHDAVAETSRFEDFQRVVVNWSASSTLRQREAALQARRARHLHAACDMRAPGAAPGMLCARDARWTSWPTRSGSTRSSCGCATTPSATRTPTSPTPARSCAPATARARSASAGTSATAEPRSMREGSELVGWGMATGIWEALQMTTRARIVLDGRRPRRGRERHHRHRHRHLHDHGADRGRHAGPAARGRDLQARRLDPAACAARRRLLDAASVAHAIAVRLRGGAQGAASRCAQDDAGLAARQGARSTTSASRTAGSCCRRPTRAVPLADAMRQRRASTASSREDRCAARTTTASTPATPTRRSSPRCGSTRSSASCA